MRPRANAVEKNNAVRRKSACKEHRRQRAAAAGFKVHGLNVWSTRVVALWRRARGHYVNCIHPYPAGPADFISSQDAGHHIAKKQEKLTENRLLDDKKQSVSIKTVTSLCV